MVGGGRPSSLLAGRCQEQGQGFQGGYLVPGMKRALFVYIHIYIYKLKFIQIHGALCVCIVVLLLYIHQLIPLFLYACTDRYIFLHRYLYMHKLCVHTQKKVWTHICIHIHRCYE